MKEFQTTEIKPPVPSEITTSPQNAQKQNLKILACSKLVISVTEHLVEVVDKLSTSSVVFFRSERKLECMCLYGA